VWVGLPAVTTLKEFEEALREQKMDAALLLLEQLRSRDRAKRSIAPARRVTGRKMTPDLARHILELHATTEMTQQEIAFRLGVNQGRVNEVIKRGKWLSGDPNSPEARTRDQALTRMEGAGRKSGRANKAGPSRGSGKEQPLAGRNSARRREIARGQLVLL
jgi:hypothetical protein